MTPDSRPLNHAVGHMLMPNHRLILQATGFLDYVTAHIDRIEYYPWPAFNDPDSPNDVLGFAVCENGVRIAQIAIADQDDIDVVATIVHEAAHLAGIGDETFAEEIAQRFLDAADVIAELFTGSMR